MLFFTENICMLICILIQILLKIVPKDQYDSLY